MEDFYTTLEEAKEEIWRRWNDVELRKKVEEYLGGDIPEGFKNGPRAVMFRNIASPDLEFMHFIEKSKELGLKPYGLEYTQDKFCTRNEDKLCLAKLAFFDKRNKNGEAIIHYEKIVDMKADDNKKFCDVNTLSGCALVDFHHNLIKNNIDVGIELFDMSSWVSRNGHSAMEYYKKFLAFLICHGILFENFMLTGEENQFTKEVFLPAYELVRSEFGYKPLIIPAIPNEAINDKYWWCYGENIKI